MKRPIFWDITKCSLLNVGYSHYLLHAGFLLAFFLNSEYEDDCSSKIWVYFQLTTELTGYGPVEGSCVHSNEPMDPIKCWEVLK
jgi:hypothetical protein